MAEWRLIRQGADYEALSSEYGVNPVVLRIMRNRGITEKEQIEEYLHGDIQDCDITDGFVDMDVAITYLDDLRNTGHRIRIIGDYDIDGVCSTAILYKGLEALGLKADYAIPHRILDGYGINVSLVERAFEDGVQTIITCDNGISAFETDGFSIFVLASGNTTLGAEARKDFLTMNPGNAFGKERSYYVMPGTTITFYAPEGKSIAWTPQSTNDLNLQSSNGSVYVVTVSPTAAVGSKSVIQANSCSATITVSSKETIVNMALTDNGVNNMSGLYFTCLTDPHNGLPAEPGVNTRTFKIIRSNYTIHIANGSNTGYTSFSGGTNPAQFIDASIANALEFVTNADGTCTLGLVDYTGKEIKKYLKNINFYTALQKLAAAGSVYAVDGIKITSNNYSGYTLIPYVLKLQTVSGFSWNLDCYIVPNSNFAVLSYNFNMPVDRYISDAYTVPSPFTSIYNVNTKQWQYAAVDRVFQVNGQYNLYDNTGNTYYPYIFKGWATSASGNVVYNPGDQVYVDKDMTLYAVWVEATADLTVTKSGCNEALDADQAFLFQITDENGKLITEITVHGNGSTTIKGLKAGRKYTVTELTDWSWRYEFCSWQFVSDDAADTKGSTNHAAVTLGTSGNTITFTNTRDEVKWLDGDTCRDNLFNKN